mmetsp:Transcript_45552/g.114788  ORF Transcript_45552/g.114788 Transcript_45552/m.114788 type:complete len:250 (+) Transcript_45552:612-1361(+)
MMCRSSSAAPVGPRAIGPKSHASSATGWSGPRASRPRTRWPPGTWRGSTCPTACTESSSFWLRRSSGALWSSLCRWMSRQRRLWLTYISGHRPTTRRVRIGVGTTMVGGSRPSLRVGLAAILGGAGRAGRVGPTAMPLGAGRTIGTAAAAGGTRPVTSCETRTTRPTPPLRLTLLCLTTRRPSRFLPTVCAAPARSRRAAQMLQPEIAQRRSQPSAAKALDAPAPLHGSGAAHPESADEATIWPPAPCR